jgi:hypothetical protein
VQGVSAAEFGQLMNDSHQSLRDNYEVSTPALDELVTLMQTESFGLRREAYWGWIRRRLCRFMSSGTIH